MSVTLVHASSPARPRPAECVFLRVALPGRPVSNAGVLLLDLESGQLHWKLRRDWDRFAGEEADVLSLLEADLAAKAAEWSGPALLAFLEDQASHTVRVTDPEPMMAADFPARLRRLYREHVAETVAPFETHLPLFDARAAAGGLSGEHTPEPAGWVEAPPGLRLTPDLFALRVEGRSMEPLIPDGALCVFRRPAGGSRQGRRLLIQRLGHWDAATRLTVKVYSSEKRATAEGWEHATVRLHPLNPEFEAWDLTPEEFTVVGEFVAVLPTEE